MRASNPCKLSGELRPALEVSSASSNAVELELSNTAGRQEKLRRHPPRLIIRDERLDGEARVTVRTLDMTRRATSQPIDVRTSVAMIDPQRAIERPAAPLDPGSSITQLLADLRGGRREAFDQILPLVYHELRRSARRELANRPSDSLSAPRNP